MDKNILIIGCGGIGCELIKIFMLKKTKKLTIIDNDTIEVTNLNRQFFFKKESVGKSKAEIIKSVYERKIRNAVVTSYSENVMCKRFDLEFFKKFDIVYNCLDNVEGRSYVSLRCKLGRTPLVDGGSAGFLGQSMVFYKGECYDCVPKVQAQILPICTIRGKPTNFVHCIAYSKDIIFSNLKKVSKKFKNLENIYNLFFGRKKIDRNDTRVCRKIQYYFKNLKKRKYPTFRNDSKDTVKFIYYVAKARAIKFGINSENFFETEKIINNIIPSVCTTNSIVASLMIVSSEKLLYHYFLTKHKKLVSKYFSDDPNSSCTVCGKRWIVMHISTNKLILDPLREEFDIEPFVLVINDQIFDQRHTKENIVVEHNSVLTLKSERETFKIYININENKLSMVEEVSLF